MRLLALLLTVFTGFSGLVYEVTWQKYVATLLGSHSEATAAVLGIFLAGLSLGYAVFGRVARRVVTSARGEGRRSRLLLTYACVEAAIGLYALAFPALFLTVQAVSWAVPHSAGGVGFAFDVVLVIGLLGPPTVLMGGTIPLLTQALSRGLDDATRFHALVYGTNTVGAFAGALAAGFVLVPQLGLAGTLAWMAVINLVAGGVFAALGWRGEVLPVVEESVSAAPVAGLNALAFVALLTGFALMVVQTVAIRLGGLALGSSEFTFSMVVAVFVLCIALGSFAVSALPRLPRGSLAFNQCALVGLLLLIYLPLQEAPYWAYVLRLQFGHSASDFLPYYAASFLGFLALIGPPAVLSGAVLPLLFDHLRDRVGDLGAVAGRLYSWNTVGSLLGALLGGYVLLFVLDLHHVYRLAVAALAVASAILVRENFRGLRDAAVVGGLVPVLVLLALLPAWKPEYLDLGLFRKRSETAATYQGVDAMVHETFGRGSNEIVFHDDDPTATIAVVETAPDGELLGRSILSNGKSDGSVPGDYTTMGLAAILPAMMARKVERGFVIGYGTGVSVGELAALETMRSVDVAEISPAVLAAAPLFDRYNLNASTRPNVRFLRSDAYRALLRSEGSYDVIVSEPSNPWVTGVEMLYSVEFLQAARERLAPGGVYAQWYHQYETDLASVALVVRTFAKVFDRIAIWYCIGPDLLILGFEDDRFQPSPGVLRERFERKDIARGLRRSRIHSLPALFAHELWPVGVAHANELSGPIHSLYHPVLNHVAAAAFFRGLVGRLPPIRTPQAVEAGVRTSLLGRWLAAAPGKDRAVVRRRATEEACLHRADVCATLLAAWLHEEPDSPQLAKLLERVASKGKRFGGAIERETVERLAAFFEAAPSAAPLDRSALSEANQLFFRHFQFAAPFDRGSLVDLWRRCDGMDAFCRVGLERARKLAGAASQASRASGP